MRPQATHRNGMLRGCADSAVTGVNSAVESKCACAWYDACHLWWMSYFVDACDRCAKKKKKSHTTGIVCYLAS